MCLQQERERFTSDGARGPTRRPEPTQNSHHPTPPQGRREVFVFFPPTWSQLKYRGRAWPGWASCPAPVGMLFPAVSRGCQEFLAWRTPRKERNAEYEGPLCAAPWRVCTAVQGPPPGGPGAVLWERKLPGLDLPGGLSTGMTHIPIRAGAIPSSVSLIPSRA